MTTNPGWYPDPADPATQRYWDGEGWLGAPLPVGATPPAGPPPAAPPPPPVPQPQTRPAPTPPGMMPGQPGAPGQPQSPYPAPMSIPKGYQVRPQGLMLAGPGRRLTARLVDIGVVLLLNAIVNGYFVYLFLQDFVPYAQTAFDVASKNPTLNPFEAPQIAAPERMSSLLYVIILLAGALWWAYEVPATAGSGQTLGKRWLGIRVIRVESAEPLGFGRAFRRWNPLGIPFLLFPCCLPFSLLLQFLDVIYVPIDTGQRMALHDRSAGTYVVKLPPNERRPS